MNFYKFLKNEESDFKGRSLSEIWNYSDEEIEKPHDFIQLIFPLNKPSRSAFHGYYLDNEEQIEIIKNDENIKNNIIRSAYWFLSFLKRNNHWKSGYNHNQLRITRIIECLKLLVSDIEAKKFYNEIMSLINDKNKINKVATKFWQDALG